MSIKVSIVVPVYNVEKYIAKCLDSLVNQDYDNYDVIVVNDGSPYNEQNIIDEYQSKYPNIIKTIIKENGGYGSALEVAFKKSDADFVLVCDSDDYVAKDAVSTLAEYQKETNADLVVGAKYFVYSNNNQIDYDKSFNDDFGQVNDRQAYKSRTKEYEMLYFLAPSPHSKLYRREIVEKIKFPHKVAYTDNLLFFYTLANANIVTYCDKPLSYYLINREGNTSTDLKPAIIDAKLKTFNSILDQVNNADDIFYYRMFESFYTIYYAVDTIKATKEEKIEKYNLIYSFLERLIPYKEKILKINREYNNDTNAMLKQKASLLTKDESRKMYDKLVHERVYGSLKTKLKALLRK